MKRWSIGEISKTRKISNRTLRYYEEIKLLTPSFKDEFGKRFYSEEDLLNLEKILILKSLSMSLEDIKQILDKLSYKQILVAHYNYLQNQLDQLEQNISNTTSLINLIELEDTISWEKVTDLIHHSTSSSKSWIDYFKEEEISILKTHLPSLSNNDEITAKYIVLLKKIETCLKLNIPPTSIQGHAIALEILQLSNQTFQGNSSLENKFWEIRKLPTEETGLFPIGNEVLEFVEKCIESLMEKEAIN